MPIYGTAIYGSVKKLFKSLNNLFQSTFELEMNQYYYRAIIANGLVCALRLNQRIPQFGLTRHCMGLILQEDSAHYLIYSILFIMIEPVDGKSKCFFKLKNSAYTIFLDLVKHLKIKFSTSPLSS